MHKMQIGALPIHRYIVKIKWNNVHDTDLKEKVSYLRIFCNNITPLFLRQLECAPYVSPENGFRSSLTYFYLGPFAFCPQILGKVWFCLFCNLIFGVFSCFCAAIYAIFSAWKISFLIFICQNFTDLFKFHLKFNVLCEKFVSFSLHETLKTQSLNFVML